MILSHSDWNSLLRDVASDPSDTPYLILGGFQRIKLLTAVPLRSLTLSYGPNSGGKGSIVDALRLLRSLHQEYLEEDRKSLLHRWHRREQGAPLTVGFSMSLSAQQLWCAAPMPPNSVSDASTDKTRIIWEASWPVPDEPDEVNFCLYVSQDLLAEVSWGKGRHTLKINDVLFASLFGNDESVELLALAHDLRERVQDNERAQGFTEIPIFLRHNLNDYEPIENHSTDYLIRGLFSTPLALALTAASSDFQLSHVGPLRRIPKPKYLEFRVTNGVVAEGTEYEQEHEVGGDGSESWRSLAVTIAFESAQGARRDHEDESVLSYINRWLMHSDFLDTGYQVAADVGLILPVDQSNDDLKMSIAAYLKTVPHDFIVKFSLIDSAERNVEFRDVGTGFSQLIPVLISCAVHNGITSIEQPELHLHPRMQGKICDLLIEAKNKELDYCVAPGEMSEDDAYELAMKWHILLVESHSEHILLRLMKRIRESAAADIRHHRFAVSPSDVSVLYFEPEGDQTFVHLLRLTEDGEFADRWPHGFFDERYQDLFDE